MVNIREVPHTKKKKLSLSLSKGDDSMANNYMNSLFGTGSNTSSGIDYSTYGLIKSGSFAKLAKAYYKNESNKTNAVSKDELKAASKKQTDMKQSAVKMKDAAKSLNNAKLYTPVKKEDGTTGLDKEAITKAAKDFVASYNDMIEKAGESDNKNVLRSAVWLTQQVKSNSGVLSDAGIKVGSDNKLTLDEDKLNKASDSTISSVLGDKGGVLSQIAQKGEQIANAASSGGTYNAAAQVSPAVAQILAGSFDAAV